MSDRIISIEVNTDDSLSFNNGKMQVKPSPKTGNTLTIESDGLYAEAIPGEPGSSGTGFPSSYRSANGITTGQTDPYTTSPAPLRVVGPSTVHRVYTATNFDGTGLILRSVDRVYPGDFFRVRDDGNSCWNYYIILSVNTTGTLVRTCSDVVASIPFTEEDIN